MSIMDLKCEQSISISTDCGCINNDNCLLLGRDFCKEYIIQLYFNLPPYSYLKNLKQARLILFKVPVYCEKNRNNCDKQKANYSVYPLLDFFSVYSACSAYSAHSAGSCMFYPARVDCSRGVNFIDNYCFSYLEVDITNIVQAWLKEEVENKGLLLVGCKYPHLSTFASDKYEIKGMRPMLRLLYEENNICPSLSTTPCTVKVGN